MKRTTRGLRGTLALVMSLWLTILGNSAPARAGTTGPTLSLRAAQGEFTITRSRNQPAYFSSGIWFETVGGAFDLRVGRSDYNHSVGITQVIHTSSGVRLRTLPADILDGWNGLAQFMHVKVTNDSGKVFLDSTNTFCPGGPDEQRVNDQGPPTPTFPNFTCFFASPFTLHTVWGVDDGWAANAFGPFGSNAPYWDGPDGHYVLTTSITKRYMDLFGIGKNEASVSVGITVKTGRGAALTRSSRATSTQAVPRAVPTIKHPDPKILPDMVALPSWGIGTQTLKGHDYLDFGATVWIGGASQLDVEGFRRPGSDIMDAFQYFYRNGKVIGRAPVGTMRFDSRNGHQHWHFEQFAGYQLLDSSKRRAVASRKVGFCIAPTDAINLELPGADWSAPFFFFFGGCGDPASIWVRESLPLGWGDTYFQNLPGQAFDITNQPNGTYYIQVQANPQHLLYERNASNDIQLRKIILGGTPGARRVKVPPWHGIDTEGGGCLPVCAQG